MTRGKITRSAGAEKPPEALRAVIAKANAAERAARRDAIAQRKVARAAAPSHVRWDWKKPPTHRTVAPLGLPHAGEDALRAERGAIEDAWDHKREGTARTHDHAARTCTGPIARLYFAGAIDAALLDAAVEIATVAERIGSDVSVRTASLETRIDAGRHGDAAIEALGRVRREVTYTQWRQQLGNARPLAMAMVIGDIGGTEGPIGYSVAAKRYRTSARKAKAVLIEALELWLTLLGDARRDIDQADVDRSAARIS